MTLEPLLQLDLPAFAGLPPGLPLAELEAQLGTAAVREEDHLGWYPALRSTFRCDSPAGGLDCYSRDGIVVLVQTLRPPPDTVLEHLGEPTGTKPHEILVEGAYAREWVWAPRGLVLTVAEPFEAGTPLRVVRCRAVRALPGVEAFGPEYHMAFEDRTVW